MFYDRLKDLCKEKDTTVTYMVRTLKMSEGNISKWKNGQSVPRGATLIKIAEYLGTTTDYLLGTTDLKAECLSILESNDEQYLLEVYRKLSDKAKAKLKELLDVLVED